ncbi:MAG: hypothetical protein AB1782_10355 [Cyanobacteriota bacterium]
MTQNQYSLSQKIYSGQVELIKLNAEKKTLETPGFFDSTKLNQVNFEIEYVSDNIRHYEKQLQQTMSEEKGEDIKELEEKAYYGDLKALEQLISMAKGDSPAAANAKVILETLAQNGDQSTAKVLLDNFGKDGSILAALVKGNSSYALDAAEKITELIGTGGSSRKIAGQDMNVQMDSKLEELVIDKLCEDPERNIHLISKFSHTERGATALSDIAVNKPTSYAGRMASRALGKAFVAGNNKVAAIALKGLTAAGSAGNVDAITTLSGIAKSPTVSMKKAAQAIDALAEIASSASQQGSENTNSAMGSLIGIAGDHRVSPKLRAYAVNHLGNLITQGADPNFNATNALVTLARTSNSPQVAEAARDSIFKASESNPEVLDKGVDLFNDVAKGDIAAPHKVRMQAVDLLGKSVENSGPNADKAVDSLKMLTKNPNKAVAKRSVDTLKNLGLAINKDDKLVKHDLMTENDNQNQNKDATRAEKNEFMIYS